MSTETLAVIRRAVAHRRQREAAKELAALTAAMRGTDNASTAVVPRAALPPTPASGRPSTSGGAAGATAMAQQVRPSTVASVEPTDFTVTLSPWLPPICTPEDMIATFADFGTRSVA